MAVHVCMSTYILITVKNTHKHTHTHTEESFTVVRSPQSLFCLNRISFLQSTSSSVCARSCVCARGQGAGAGARMEMFGECRGQEGWVDCWVMSHWSLLQSLLSNPNAPLQHPSREVHWNLGLWMEELIGKATYSAHTHG